MTTTVTAAERLKALVLIAPAPDFTEALMWARFPQEVKDEILATGLHAYLTQFLDRVGDLGYGISRDFLMPA